MAVVTRFQILSFFFLNISCSLEPISLHRRTVLCFRGRSYCVFDAMFQRPKCAFLFLNCFLVFTLLPWDKKWLEKTTATTTKQTKKTCTLCQYAPAPALWKLKSSDKSFTTLESVLVKSTCAIVKCLPQQVNCSIEQFVCLLVCCFSMEQPYAIL